ncbi:glycosyltransferase family 4 protein [Reyranella sp.]|uniref:glycosyltransferase family 4 protein n=1 Tax=Reyranella sp. TaxID=1929291 RepID=UPI003BA86665
MRFLFFTGGWTAGGMEAAFLSLMKGLAARGHCPAAVVSGWNDGQVPGLLRDAGIPHHEVPLGRLYLTNPLFTWHSLRHMPVARRQLRAIAAEVRPDWIVSPDVQTLLLSAGLLPGRRALFLQSPPERLMRNRWAGRLLDRRLDRVLCVSRFIAEAARATPIDPAKLALVPNGVALPADRRFVARRPVRLGIVGRIVEQKQHAVLIEACALLRSRLPGAFRLDIVGPEEGAAAAGLVARIEELGLGDCVRWVGWVADRERLYGSLDVVVAPAVDEPFGLTVPEAGAHGLPVVAARSGAFPELVEDGVTGLLFAPRDAADLAWALERLVGDPGLRERLGRAGRAHVAAHFGIGTMTDRFLAACDVGAPPVAGAA